MAKANRFVKNDEGVSAVIGVILMVAITVILAAVIAAFVFGMVGGVNQKKIPTVTLKRINSTYISATVQDMGGAMTIDNFKVTQPSDTSVSWTNGTSYESTHRLQVGDTLNIHDVPASSHVVITASVDGTTTVIEDTNI